MQNFHYFCIVYIRFIVGVRDVRASERGLEEVNANRNMGGFR